MMLKHLGGKPIAAGLVLLVPGVGPSLRGFDWFGGKYLMDEHNRRIGRNPGVSRFGYGHRRRWLSKLATDNQGG